MSEEEASKTGCCPPEGFVCETEEGVYNGVKSHLYHNPKTGEYRTAPVVEWVPKKEEPEHEQGAATADDAAIAPASAASDGQGGA